MRHTLSEIKWPLMDDAISWGDRLAIAKFALTTKKFTAGEQVAEFEREWNGWLGSDYSLFVSSGSTANFLLVAAVMEKYGLKPGDKVLLPAITWMTNVAPIMQLGLQPIFCDVNPSDFSFDDVSLQEVRKHHPDVKMVFVTHLLGLPANQSFKDYFPSAIVIDDVCESHGATRNGNKIGADSLGATFSFYFGHHMTTIEGGMVSTYDEDLYDIMKMKRSHGLARESIHFKEYASHYRNISPQFLFITDGYNFRNHEIPALLGRRQLKNLDNNIQIRRENYDDFRATVNWYPDVYVSLARNDGNSSFCLPIIARNRVVKDMIEIQLRKHGIESRPIVSGNLMSQPFLEGYSMYSNPFNKQSHAQIIQDLGLYIGNSQFVGDRRMRMIEKIIREVAKDYAKNSRRHW